MTAPVTYTREQRRKMADSLDAVSEGLLSIPVNITDVKTICAMLRQAAAQGHGSDDTATRIVQAVAELPDRTSPDDWPEAMLVTADELRAIISAELEAQR